LVGQFQVRLDHTEDCFGQFFAVAVDPEIRQGLHRFNTPLGFQLRSEIGLPLSKRLAIVTKVLSWNRLRRLGRLLRWGGYVAKGQDEQQGV